MLLSLGETNRGSGEPHGPAAPGYETRDINTRAVLGFLGLLFVVLALTLFATWWLFRYFSAIEREPAPPASFADVRQLPSAPELEVNARKDLLRAQAEQERELEMYSWEDHKAQIVRIPIDRAMDLLLQKGLPVLPLATEEEKGTGRSDQKGVQRATDAGASSRKESKGNN